MKPQPAGPLDDDDNVVIMDAPAAEKGTQRFPAIVDVLDLAATEPPEREWAIESLLPFGTSALFAAHGGSGKTLLELTMAVCIALGLSFMGLPTQRAVVMLILAEDDRDEIHRRLHAVCASLGVDLAALAGRLHAFDAVGCDVALFSRRAGSIDGRAIYTAAPDVTDAYDWLRERIEGLQPRVLFLDSVSDMYDAEENRRADVRRYLNSVLALMLPQHGAVVHIAHIDKFAARGGATNAQTFSGSTAWNNSVRTRLALTRAQRADDDDPAADDGRRILTVEKSNYSRPGFAIPLRYDSARHVFVRDGDDAAGIVGAIRTRSERRAVLVGLLAAGAAGRSVLVAPRANDNAATILSRLPDFPSALRNAAGRKRLFEHLLDLEADGAVEREAFRTPSKHTSERWRVTDAGRAEAESRP